eukprot:TRINITY_DN27346_c0_g1_i1.p1 TRINITY_DN27346_c0_g1~~TRINITY_DN27346_c0_g1_i1.p1  ORF type:complete len:644 (-),score=83.71 TRINITY_DN27346_c0_g1_i1:88-1965(-)
MASSFGEASRPECRYFQMGCCNMMRNAWHARQFSHPCKFGSKCSKLTGNDTYHMSMFDHPGAKAQLAMLGEGPKKVCQRFLEGRCQQLNDPQHLLEYSHGPESNVCLAFTFDCEFIWTRQKNSPPQRCPVSIGLVDQHMETLLYSRIQKPRDSIVTDDRSSRILSGIRSNWSHGLSLEHVSSMIVRLVDDENQESKRSMIVGWSIGNDLRALGFGSAANKVEAGQRREIELVVDSSDPGEKKVVCDIVELQDFYRTKVKDQTARLKEAFRAMLQRDEHAHDAMQDAKMTMELYLAWDSQGRTPVKYEIDTVILTVHSVGQDGRLSCSVTAGMEKAECLETGAMVRLMEGSMEGQERKEGSMQARPKKLAPGCLNYLRRHGPEFYLFSSRWHATNGESWDGLLHVLKAENAVLQVVNGLFQLTDRQDKPFTPQTPPQCVYGQGEVLKEMVVAVDCNGKRQDQVWMQVSNAEAKDPLEPAGWVRKDYRQGSILRVIRPFALELYFYQLRFEEFSSDCAAARFQLLLLLKPGLRDDTDQITENQSITKDGMVEWYSLTFRYRASRNAYWHSLMKKQQIHTPLGEPEQVEEGVKPWTQNPGLSRELKTRDQYGNDLYGKCKVHLWDEPR